MAVTVSFIIADDTKADRIADAFDAEFPGRLDAGLTKRQWVKRLLVDYTRQVLRNHEGNQSAATARQTVNSDVDSIVIT